MSLLAPSPVLRAPLLLPIAPPVPAELLRAEVAALPEKALLLRQGCFSVWLAGSSEIPGMMSEIARQREITFRQVGEGTGRAEDRDEYDEWYQHLFLWDEAAGCLAGAYRLGRTDVVLQKHGAKGLYTSTLFEFAPEFLAYLNPGLELGRSFIIPSYQRQHQTLPLIWRGIAAFVVRNPQYHLLFGPVSISNDYSQLSQSLMVQYLRSQRLHPELASLVKPRAPFQEASTAEWLSQVSGSREAVSETLQSIDQVTALVAAVEPDRKGMPVLLRHYLKLNAYALNFNVDALFSNVLDVLVLTDLRQSSVAQLRRYMGDEGHASFVRAVSMNQATLPA